MRIAFLRHGPTEWNDQGRIQGRIDIPLSITGRAKMSKLLPPEGFERARAFTSPLLRARETAMLLGLANIAQDQRLSEHDWGDWEGLTREEILARYGKEAFLQAGEGINFTPKNGETTRDLLARVAAFVHDTAQGEGDAIAISHRGVLRAAYALATNWKMLSPMPEKLDLAAGLILFVDSKGNISIAAQNVPLRPRTV